MSNRHTAMFGRRAGVPSDRFASPTRLDAWPNLGPNGRAVLPADIDRASSKHPGTAAIQGDSCPPSSRVADAGEACHAGQPPHCGHEARFKTDLAGPPFTPNDGSSAARLPGFRTNAQRLAIARSGPASSRLTGGQGAAIKPALSYVRYGPAPGCWSKRRERRIPPERIAHLVPRRGAGEPGGRWRATTRSFARRTTRTGSGWCGSPPLTSLKLRRRAARRALAARLPGGVARCRSVACGCSTEREMRAS